MEASVTESLKEFPPEAGGTALAQSMIHLARLLDHDEVNPRDVPNFHKEIRQTIAQLKMEYPPEPEDDVTAKAQKRMNSKMTGLDDWDF
jgi:hypothetical protein